jgi:hypothetical protein
MITELVFDPPDSFEFLDYLEVYSSRNKKKGTLPGMNGPTALLYFYESMKPHMGISQATKRYPNASKHRISRWLDGFVAQGILDKRDGLYWTLPGWRDKFNIDQSSSSGALPPQSVPLSIPHTSKTSRPVVGTNQVLPTSTSLVTPVAPVVADIGTLPTPTPVVTSVVPVVVDIGTPRSHQTDLPCLANQTDPSLLTDTGTSRSDVRLSCAEPGTPRSEHSESLLTGYNTVDSVHIQREVNVVPKGSAVDVKFEGVLVDKEYQIGPFVLQQIRLGPREQLLFLSGGLVLAAYSRCVMKAKYSVAKRQFTLVSNWVVSQISGLMADSKARQLFDTLRKTHNAKELMMTVLKGFGPTIVWRFLCTMRSLRSKETSLESAQDPSSDIEPLDLAQPIAGPKFVAFGGKAHQLFPEKESVIVPSGPYKSGFIPAGLDGVPLPGFLVYIWTRTDRGPTPLAMGFLMHDEVTPKTKGRPQPCVVVMTGHQMDVARQWGWLGWSSAHPIHMASICWRVFPQVHILDKKTRALQPDEIYQKYHWECALPVIEGGQEERHHLNLPSTQLLSGADLAMVKVDMPPPGVRAAQWSHMSDCTHQPMHAYGLSKEGGLLKSMDGAWIPGATMPFVLELDEGQSKSGTLHLEEDLGVSLHRVNTQKGFSGSPMVGKTGNSHLVICGMQLGCVGSSIIKDQSVKGTNWANSNYSVTVDALRNAGKDFGVFKGMVPETPPLEVSVESPPPRSRQSKEFYRNLSDEWKQYYRDKARARAQQCQQYDDDSESLPSFNSEHADHQEELIHGGSVYGQVTIDSTQGLVMTVGRRRGRAAARWVDTFDSECAIQKLVTAVVQEMKKPKISGELTQTIEAPLSVSKESMLGTPSLAVLQKTMFQDMLAGVEPEPYHHHQGTEDNYRAAGLLPISEHESVSSPRVQEAEAVIYRVVETEGPLAFPDLLQFTQAELLSTPYFLIFHTYTAAGDKNWSEFADDKDVFFDSNGEPCFTKIGTCKPSGHFGDGAYKQMPSEVIATMKRLTGVDFDFKPWYWPPEDVGSARVSLREQSKKQKRSNWVKPIKEKYPNGVDMEQYYKLYPWNRSVLLGRENGFKTMFDVCIQSYEFKKSTGWTGNYLDGPKGRWFKEPKRSDMYHLVMCRAVLRYHAYHTMKQHHLRLGTLHPKTMVKLGLTDPKIAFIKGEPHEQKKIDAWRLIWNVSFVDQLNQDILHREQNKLDISAYQKQTLTIQANGMGHHDAGVDHLGEVMLGQFQSGEATDADASGWDLSVPRDGIMMDGDRRVSRLIHPEGDEQGALRKVVIVDLLEIEAVCNTAHVVAIGEDLYQSNRFGITASGVPSTSGQNSPMRSIQVLLAGAESSISLGDDLLYQTKDGSIDRHFMEKCGVRTKGIPITKKLSDGVEFTSHQYKLVDDKWVAYYLNFDKMVARLVYQFVLTEVTPAMEVLAAVHHVVRADPSQVKSLTELAQEYGWIADELPEPCSAMAAKLEDGHL